MRKLLSLFVAALFSVTMFADKQLYLRVSTGDDGWNDVTKFAIYYFNDTQNGWTGFMTPVEENVYTAAIPEGMTTVIFTRQNKDADEPNWDNRWSQTKNKDLPTDGKNLFTITSGGRTWDCDGEWSVYEPAPVDPNKFYVTGDSALVVDAGLDKAKAWNEKAIGSEKDTLVLTLKADQDYLLKVVDEGAWKGFESLTDTAAGLNAEASLGGEHNIGFKLSAAGEVQVIYKAGELFKLVGAFAVPEPEPEPEYFLVGSVKGWDAAEANKFAATATEGEFKLAATLALDEEIKVMGIQGEDTTWYPAGLGNAFVVTEKYTGEHDIYFRPAGNSPDWDAFGGFFWMGANPDPEPELVELNLVPGPWVDGSNAKIAAWIWGEKLAGEWTEFIGLEGDTLKFNVKETADSIIFVRFDKEAEAPDWYKDGKIWNRMPDEEIDYVGKTYTITAYDKGQWEPYIITPFNLYLALGKWGEPDEKARYAIYTIDDAKWIDLAAVESKEDVLFAEVPGTITKVVFCRLNPDSLENDWRFIWNQTEDLIIPEDKDQFTITGWGEGEGAKSVGEWSKFGEEPLPVEAEYFFIGSRIDWSVPALTEDLKFTLNEGAEVEEYKLDITLVAGEYFKIVKLEGETQTWFIEGDDKARLVAEEEAGDVTIYFRPEANPSWAETDLGGHIYIHKATTGVEETAVQGKAVKALRDGQLIIIKNGVRYNVIGIRF